MQTARLNLSSNSDITERPRIPRLRAVLKAPQMWNLPVALHSYTLQLLIRSAYGDSNANVDSILHAKYPYT